MILDLTTMLTADHPMIAWAKTKENPHIAMGHVGIHLDTYEKTKIPLEYFRSRGILFQVVGIGEVTEDDIDLTKIQEGDFVLFRTGRSEEYAYGEKEYFPNHPKLSLPLIEKLVEKRFISLAWIAPAFGSMKNISRQTAFAKDMAFMSLRT